MEHKTIFNGGIITDPLCLKGEEEDIFCILQNDDAEVLNIDSTDLSGGGTRRPFKFRPNGDKDVDPAAHVRGIDFRLRLGGVGTNAGGTRGGNFVLVCRNGMTATGATGADTLRALSSGFNWASSSTCAIGFGLYNTALVGGGTNINAGLVTDLVGNRSVAGFQDSVGTGDGDTPLTGSITNAVAFRGIAPSDVSAGGSHPIDTVILFEGEDVTGITDVTNAYFLKGNGGESDFGGGMTFKRVATATSYSVVFDDYHIGVTDTTAPRQVVIPSNAALVSGKTYVVVDESGAAGTNNITIATQGAETINGAATAVIAANYGFVKIRTDGTNWFVVG